MAGGIAIREEDLPEKYKQWYWRRLAAVTFSFFVVWTVIAVWWHIPAQLFWTDVLLFGNMPLHWYLAAFISIVVGIILIFIYSFVMDRIDNKLRKMVMEELARGGSHA